MSKAQLTDTSHFSSTDTNVIVIKDWGISFTKSPDWIVTKNTWLQVQLTNTKGEAKGSLMTIDFIGGTLITDIDAKFGAISYFYDYKKEAWTMLIEYEFGPEGLTPEPAVPFATTADSLPMFRGRGRFMTIIIPLTKRLFLKLNTWDYPDALEALARTIRKI